MTEINEKAIQALEAKGYSKDKCPFCGKDHEAASEDGEDTEKVVSKPEQLDCKMSGGKSDRRSNAACGPTQYAYTLAKHHLISAKQCYARLPPLVRMGSLANYDINDPPNGIGLPTTHWRLKYPDGSGVKYGSLDDRDKTKYSFALMEELEAQWHVGHHSFEYNLPFEELKSSGPDDWGDEVDEKTTVGHETGYDIMVLSKLIKLMQALFERSPSCCEEPDKNKIKEKFDEISEEIRTDLEKFQTRPADSELYVSWKAYAYAKSGGRKEEPEISRPKKRRKKV